MKITIYNEPCRGGLGGSEVSAAVLAEALSKDHEVEIAHYRKDLDRKTLGEFASVDLSGVSLRFGPPLDAYKGSACKVFTRFNAEKRQEAALSSGCDLFIAFVHEPPPFCAAPQGILWVLFPFHPLNDPNLVKRTWHRHKLQKRLRTYQDKLAISAFAARWTKKRWDAEVDVLFPPVEVASTVVEKKFDRILSVGRFSTDGHGKKQIEMLESFENLRSSLPRGWDYNSIGACSPLEKDQLFLAEVRSLANRMEARVISNISRDELRTAYAQAKIFWHATGLGLEEEEHPERSEHFGITTVEAMAAGCVPVVINKGGQREIVEHGVSGFLWNSLDELEQFTLRLIEDEAKLREMSAAARARAQLFSREDFVRRFKALVNESGRAREAGSFTKAAAIATGV